MSRNAEVYFNMMLLHLNRDYVALHIQRPPVKIDEPPVDTGDTKPLFCPKCGKPLKACICVKSVEPDHE